MDIHPLSGLFGTSLPQTEVEKVASRPTEPIENIYYEIPSGMLEKLLSDPYDGTTHPNFHLIFVDEVCELFQLADLSRDEVKKKVFPLFLEGKALMWYRLLDNIESWDWNRLKLEFHQKFYPMHLVHHDCNYIYNLWPHKGESTAQAWGRLKSMMHTCPNHELPREMIIQKNLCSAFSG